MFQQLPSCLRASAVHSVSALFRHTQHRLCAPNSWHLTNRQYTASGNNNLFNVGKDTIVALSSGSLPAGVAVVRVSGPQASSVAAALCPKRSSYITAQPRTAHYVKLFDPVSGEQLDSALALWFPGPASFTGEDVLELHCHGSRAVVADLLRAITMRSSQGTAQVRPAQAGEFTRRAVLNGKLRLTEAEGVGDLLSAVTASQRRQALGQMQGALNARLLRWREQLLGALAHLEASIDFGDEEEDVSEDVADGAVTALQVCRDDMQQVLQHSTLVQTVADGVSLSIVGAPNAGKSSLMNALLQEEVSIVTPTAGTTRDVVSRDMALGGVPVHLSDTAGLRQRTDDSIEAAGIQRAHDTVAASQVALLVLDAPHVHETGTSLSALCDGLPRTLPLRTLVALNKDDSWSAGDQERKATQAHVLLALQEQYPQVQFSFHHVSARTSWGVPSLLDALAQACDAQLQLGTAAGGGDTGALLTRQRHIHHIQEALACLDAALSAWRGGGVPLLPAVAEDTREALRQVGQVAGEATADNVLDVVFRDFCIGK